MFWISSAYATCTTREQLDAQFIDKSDVHSPENLRINIPLSNIPEFGRDFGCSKTSKMNPAKKCTVW